MDKDQKYLIKACLKKANDKLSSAKKLFTAKKYDDSVSRAYYCVFYASQALLLCKNMTTKSHHGLVQMFGLHFMKTREFDPGIGIILNRLKDLREKGDYEIFSTIDNDDAKQAINDCRLFLKECKKYLSKYF